MTSSQRDQNGNVLEVLGRVFRYDQLNRIKKADVFTDTNLLANNYWSAVATNTNKWHEEFTFDGNGNIQTLKRHNASGTLMDNLSYTYAANKNQLTFVDDAASSTASTDDIEDQNAGNYSYDKLGNLVTDASEQIAKITWNTSGKITAITRTPGSNKPDLEFVYDASGMRIGKVVKPKLNGVLEPENKWVTTWYSKDVSGQVLAVYEQKFTMQSATNYTLMYDLVERHLYGGSRLGVHNDQQAAIDWTFTATVVNGVFTNEANWATSPVPQPISGVRSAARKLGNKLYELCNHLGNVLSTVSDRRKAVGSAGVVDYYVPEVMSYNEYYVYGANLGGTRSYSSSALKYRYGFNGKENDTEVSSSSYNFDARFNFANFGKWISIDPEGQFQLSQYIAFANNPIKFIDPDGRWIPGIDERGIYLLAEKNDNIQSLRSYFNNNTNAQKYLQDIYLNNKITLLMSPNSKVYFNKSNVYSQAISWYYNIYENDHRNGSLIQWSNTTCHGVALLGSRGQSMIDLGGFNNYLNNITPQVRDKILAQQYNEISKDNNGRIDFKKNGIVGKTIITIGDGHSAVYIGTDNSGVSYFLSKHNKGGYSIDSYESIVKMYHGNNQLVKAYNIKPEFINKKITNELVKKLQE